MDKNNNAHSENLFEYRSVEKKKLLLSLYITFVVMVLEFVGGFLSNSIALVSDAGHMFTHCFAIGVGLIAIIVAGKPTCHHKTFGLYRAEVLAAFINGIFLAIVVVIIVYEAILRILHPKEVAAAQMLVIAIIGLIVNIVTIFILHGNHKEDLNIKGVFYHMIADAASSVGIVIAAIVMSFTGWNFLDPLISIGISLLIAYWAWGIIKESGRVLLEMAPHGLNIDTVSENLRDRFPEIKEMYGVHLWTITAEMLVFSAHVVLYDGVIHEDGLEVASRINKHLFENFRILESTIQIINRSETDSRTLM